MLPVASADTIQSSPSFFFDCEMHKSNDLLFHKENYKAIVRDVRYDGQPICYSVAHQDWLTVLMLVEFFFYCYFLVRYGKVWFERIKGIWEIKEYAGLHMNLYEKNKQESIFCLLMTVINLSLFAYLSMTRDVLFPDSQDMKVLMFLLIILVFLIVKLLLSRFVSEVFFSRDDIALLNSEINSLFSYLGLLMYGILLVMFYATDTSQVMFWAGISSIGLYAIFKMCKIYQVFYAGWSTIFYLFLYLCTLEIIPIISLYLGLLFVVKGN